MREKFNNEQIILKKDLQKFISDQKQLHAQQDNFIKNKQKFDKEKNEFENEKLALEQIRIENSEKGEEIRKNFANLRRENEMIFKNKYDLVSLKKYCDQQIMFLQQHQIIPYPQYVTPY